MLCDIAAPKKMATVTIEVKLVNKNSVVHHFYETCDAHKTFLTIEVQWWINQLMDYDIIKSPRYTGGDFMFLYRFIRRRPSRRRRPQTFVQAITFEQLLGFLSFLAWLLVLTYRLPD